MNRIPIRLKLTIAFASALVVVLVAAGWFVYGRLRDDLDESVDLTLRARWVAAQQLMTDSNDLSSFPLEEIDEGFVQLLDGSGRLITHAGRAAQPALVGADFETAQTEIVTIEREVPGIEGVSRVLAGPVAQGVLVAGQTLANRDEALRALLASFAIGTPVAALVASVVGFALARSGLAPVEAIRHAANEVSHAGDGRRLPVPPANDEIRRLAETLNQMVDRLEQAAAREQRFVADAAHELRTPIAIAKAELEAVQMSGETSESLQSASDELDRLAQLAEDLLVLARTSEAGLSLVRQPVEVESILEAVRARFAARAEWQDRRIELVANVPRSVEIDPQRISQALSNLIDNALRHGKGELTIRAGLDGADLLLAVSDEGGGFDAGVVDRAFDRFSRGDSARTGGGAGLGLAIVKAIVEAHGGSVSIAPGDSATVEVRIPV